MLRFILHTIVLVVGPWHTVGFTPLSPLGSCFPATPVVSSNEKSAILTSSPSSLLLSSASNDNPIYSSSSSSSPLSSTGFLSHVMLKVPNVDETVDYWTSQGGTVRISRPVDIDIDIDDESHSPSGEDDDINESSKKPSLKSAFVEMGRSGSSSSDTGSSSSSSSSQTTTFALEIVRAPPSSNDKPFKVGNEICYIGLSKLLLFQNNLLGVITGEATKEEKADREEPNGIGVEFSASAPGDLFARICLRSNDLIATSDFYSNILGMDIKAQDDKMLCLRYENDSFPTDLGVATTIVFDATDTNTPIEKGECFDHIAITTSSSIDELCDLISKPSLKTSKLTAGDEPSDESSKDIDLKIFMKPTEMFGKRVMGLIDPNGYKVVVAGS
mmetsp:Transcript_42104/g.101250  ORF Transcript_42104/g.101250 Transcript_42104/m.101250 type:complete len:386 (+) Transcript_42104:75-1232(+)